MLLLIDVRKQRNRERPPALQGHYAKGLPARENRGQPSTIRNKRPAFATRKVVPVAQRETMPHIEIRTASLAAVLKLSCGKFGSPALEKKLDALSIDFDQV